MVCVNRDVAFHGGRGVLGTIANKVSEICKAAGALVTDNDRLWRVAHALTGKNYKIPELEPAIFPFEEAVRGAKPSVTACWWLDPWGLDP